MNCLNLHEKCLNNFLGFGDAAGRRLDLNFRTVFYYSLSRN